ncbi:MAG: NUDIX domain-containing protein [Clostridiales bacterium]|nr:NUDIX domain-containing protein [Clostridiales bacterium]
MTCLKQTTLCYLTRSDEILFIVKGNTLKNISNMNAGKYLGVGGHMEDGESPYECAVREIYEETGIPVSDISGLALKGVATFINDSCDDEIMYIYKGEYTGKTDPCPGTCGEGVLKWVNIKDIGSIPAWEGDRHFFKLLFSGDDSVIFEIKLVYHGDELIEVKTY